MPSITIDYTIEEGKIIQRLAQIQGKTAKEYVELVLRTHTKSQINGYYQDKFNSMTLQEKIALFGDIQ